MPAFRPTKNGANDENGPSDDVACLKHGPHVDGKRAVQFDWNEASMVFSIPGGGLADPPPAWNVGADGVLTLVGVIGDQVKRFRIMPSADTNISTMIAAAAEAVDGG